MFLLNTSTTSARDLLSKIKRASNGKKIKIALDVDGVLANSQQAILDAWNEETGARHTLTEWNDWDLRKNALGLSGRKFVELYDKVWMTESERIAPTISEAYLMRLLSKFNVDIVTARPEAHRGDLDAWLRRNFPQVPLNVVLSESTLHGGQGKARSKFYLDYNVYIDDGNPLAEDMTKHSAGTGKLLLLIAAPWNENKGYESCDNIIAMGNLRAAIDMLS